ncbi:thiosulfate oxidation carrier protein SoxY [Paenirhodobacter sp.]|uniref:thiosulfate oxidation carrier protein SoxY n=1 Tax=Paenirhodobacter sp. TaxID=1965326 RepID=UPI003B3ED830
MTSCAELSRRAVLAGAAVLAAGVAAAEPDSRAVPQPDDAESDRIATAFLNGATPLPRGLALDLPALGDNPAAVPVRVHLTEPTGAWCEELIVLAQRNPKPLACRFRFTPLTGSVDVALRLRLMQSMGLRAIARMSDGRFLEARGEITVAAGGCGM